MAKAKKEEGIESYKTETLVPFSATNFKQLVKESEGVPIVFEDPEMTELTLMELRDKTKLELDELEKLESLDETKLKRLEELEKQFRTNRYALQNIRSHNSSIFTQWNKKDKAKNEEFVAIIQPTETRVVDLIDAENNRIAAAAAEREKKIEDEIEKIKNQYQDVIDELTDYSGGDAAIEKFAELGNTATIDFHEFTADFEEMVSDMEVALQEKIDELKIDFDLEEANKKEEIATLKAERLEELFDDNHKYKGEKNLGELTEDEYNDILLPARLSFRTSELAKIGFEKNPHQDEEDEIAWQFVGLQSVISIDQDDIVSQPRAEWELTFEELKEKSESAILPLVEEISTEANEMEVIESPIAEVETEPETEATTPEVAAPAPSRKLSFTYSAPAPKVELTPKQKEAEAVLTKFYNHVMGGAFDMNTVNEFIKTIV